MKNTNSYDLELESLKEASIDIWLKQEIFDNVAFEKLYKYLERKSEFLKGEYVISKQIVNITLSAFNSLEAVGEKKMANKFFTLLELIAINESASDRVPGVPRVH